MSGRDRRDEPSLFDLPLDPPPRREERPPAAAEQPAEPAPGAGARRAAATGPSAAADDELPLFPAEPAPRSAAAPPSFALDREDLFAAPPTAAEAPADAEPDPGDIPEEAAGSAASRARRAGFGARLGAVALDLVALAAVAGGGLLGAALLGVGDSRVLLPGVGVFLLVFSFAYSVVPLAFWGATPGMAMVGLIARGRDGGPLTFGQTALRWLLGLVTVALAGLPLLLALGPLGGRSLADRVAGGNTWHKV